MENTENFKDLIQFKNVNVMLNGISILENINLKIPKDSWIAIIGPNGAGKTTLLLALLKQIPFIGEIVFASSNPPQNLKIGYVPQRFNMDRAMPITVIEFLIMSSQKMPLWLRMFHKHKLYALSLLDMVGIKHLANRKVGELSGGEMQRLLLALALQYEPQLLILDEPTSGIDIAGERMFCELIQSLRDKFKFTVLMVSHDLGMIMHHASYAILLNKTVIAEGHPNEVITQKNLLSLFGIHLGIADKQSIKLE